PKGLHIPSSGASMKTSDSPPPSLSSANLNFEILPRGPARPSEPDPIVSPSPPLSSANLNFEILPRGPARPSEPDPIVSPSPPPPHRL
ncbi:hypothetical protein L195_g058931, partial [Trifolium pratense]